MKPIKKDDIAIAVMFYNKPEQTVECLKSFEGYNIHLLNNGSDPAAEKYLLNHYKNRNITMYDLPKNIGVARGRNYLIKQIDAKWIFFVDNDITIRTKDWFKQLQEAIKKYPDVLAFVPNLYNVHMGSMEKFYTFSIQKDLATTQITKTGRSNKISGGASIINKELFKVNGLYDEGFFVGFEDFEFALRAIRNGRELNVVQLPQIILDHDHKQATTDYDDKYVKVRYNPTEINKSYERVKALHGFTLSDNGVKWAENKIAQMSKKNTNPRITLYHHDQVGIGGVETFNRNFCKRMSKFYDITFLCKSADAENLKEIMQYADIQFYTGQQIETDIFIYGVSWGQRPDKVKAQQYLQMVHGDFEWMKKDLNFNYKPIRPDIQHISVGKNVAEKFTKVTGLKSTVIYNILDLDTKPEQVLNLISVMRLGREKGLERILIMASKLKESGRKFIWHIYGDGMDKTYIKEMKAKFINLPEVIFMGMRRDTASFVANADYLVALSKSEGFSYSIYEALQLGVPCIVTDFPSAYEQVEDGKSGYILKMDLSNLDIDKLYNNIPNKFVFKEKSDEKDWLKFLGSEGKVIKRKKINRTDCKVKVIRPYTDLKLNRKFRIGDVIEVDQARALELLGKKLIVISAQ